MPQVVLKLPNKTINEMKTHYANVLKAAPPSAIFAAKSENCTITAYQSGKVLFQGKAPDKEASKWGKVESKPVSTKKKTSNSSHSYSPPQSLFASSHIGSDEAGTGDYFGPITVAAAYVTDDQIPLLKEIGVKDSKNLTDTTIQSIAKDLLKLEMPYSLVILHNNKYNSLQQKGWTQGKMKTILHHHAINKLLEKIKPDQPTGILIDQFSQPNVYKKHLQSENKKLQKNVYFMTKAESYSIAVAAGSIIARASFVREMDKLSKQIGVNLPKGASNKVDQVAGKIIRQHGKSELNRLAKTHFANTQKAEKYK